MSDLYPAVEPYEHGMLDVGDGHSVYWEVRGDPRGKPAVVLHGGPGSGCGPRSGRPFDPERYRVVLFDQRNCGRSTPSARERQVDLSANTTAHLIADIELLRAHLGIERWLVYGGSWGVSLGLAYAQAHPERVSEMVLVAITGGTRREVDWITRDMGRVFPREWDRFVSLVPEVRASGSLPAAYSRLLHCGDAVVEAHAAAEWCLWEDTHMSLAPDWQPSLSVADPGFQLQFARLVTHYWAHDHFLDDGQLLRDAARLAGIPGVMVHGRYDVSGPLDTAWHLERAWPDSELVVVGDAGHSSASMGPALRAATDRFASHG